MTETSIFPASAIACAPGAPSRHDAQDAVQASGVSERYLAQLEAGEGNISVLLLRKVAHAWACRSTAWCARTRRMSARPKPIALLGLRGAASHARRALAEAMKLPFVELDREVEKEAGAE
jgi:XRE family aerobic/anaerobic benzoate catabolism transcriptional regulator